MNSKNCEEPAYYCKVNKPPDGKPYPSKGSGKRFQKGQKGGSSFGKESPVKRIKTKRSRGQEREGGCPNNKTKWQKEGK